MKTLHLVSGTSRIYEIEVYQESGQFVRNRSHSLSVNMVITTIIFPPGEQKTYRENRDVWSSQG
ncbi:MAG: hypothetical protein ACPLRX_01275 [Candidatus Saccharicenans sp.]